MAAGLHLGDFQFQIEIRNVIRCGMNEEEMKNENVQEVYRSTTTQNHLLSSTNRHPRPFQSVAALAKYHTHLPHHCPNHPFHDAWF